MKKGPERPCMLKRNLRCPLAFPFFNVEVFVRTSRHFGERISPTAVARNAEREARVNACRLFHAVMERKGRTLELFPQLFNDHRNGRIVRTAKEDHELVPSTTTHEIILAQKFSGDLAERPEHFIAGRMSVGIVDRLEIVEVDHHQCNMFVVFSHAAMPAPQQFFDDAVKVLPREHAGQRIVRGFLIPLELSASGFQAPDLCFKAANHDTLHPLQKEGPSADEHVSSPCISIDAVLKNRKFSDYQRVMLSYKSIFVNDWWPQNALYCRYIFGKFVIFTP